MHSSTVQYQISFPKGKGLLDYISEEELLNLRICDLPVKIAGTWLAECIEQLYQELQSRGLVFRPECYLADEWMTPDQEPVIGIPFFLAHPTLIKLEKKMMMEAEGSRRASCMQLLRHETGHAINYAYRLFKRRKWREYFGRFSSEYGDTYRFRPYSHNYVRHLKSFYAQYHPDEDFTETFAVWLTPGSDWAQRYQGWKALEKLKYVDALMREIGPQAPVVKKGKKYWQLATLRGTLRNFYKKKRDFYAEDFPDFHDENLKRIFVLLSTSSAAMPEAASVVAAPAFAADFLKQHHAGIVSAVCFWTKERKYIVNQLLHKIAKRCRQLGVCLGETPDVSLVKITSYLTTLIMNYRYTGWFRGKYEKKA